MVNRRLWHYIRPYSFYLLLALFLAVITVCTTLYTPIVIGEGVDLVAGPGQVQFAALKPLLLKLLVLIAITTLSQWCMTLATNRAAYSTIRDIREDAYKKLTKAPLSYLDRRPQGDILSRVIADVDQVGDGLLIGFTQLFSGVLTILGTFGFMLRLSVPITLVVVLLTPLSFFMAGFLSRMTFRLFGEQARVRGDMTAFAEEMVGSQPLVKTFGREAANNARFAQINEALQVVGVKALFYSAITNPGTRFINGLVYAAVGILGAFKVLSGGLTVGQLTSFLSYANQYTKPFNEISGVITELQGAFAAARHVFEIIDAPVELPDAPDALALENAKGQVDLFHVSFRYEPDVPFMEDLNLHVVPGQRIALVGPTGCGKTTFINLLMRFHEIDGGKIGVDGHPVTTIQRDALRRQYGMVLQDTWLMHGSVRENIAYGRPDASLEDIMEAAKKAHAHSFIVRLPDGYDTILDESGGSLSAGQKQLLCISRVMLDLPPMLILDEATSSIDTMTEQRISRAFETLMEGRTSFVVAHRLSTIQSADCILVMQQGKIIERGTHRELLDRKGFYAQLFSSQFDTAE